MDFRHLFNGSFNEKTVLITGHTGFKGAWLSLWLKELGAKVIGYSLEPPSDPSLFEQCKLGDKMHSIKGDVRDLNCLQEIISEIQPEIVFHLAAQPLVRRSYSTPVETVATNVLGTVNVLEAIRKSGPSVRVCQVITSDKCYENDESHHAYSEGDRLGGFDPYSASKACAELMISAYRNSFFQKESISKHGVSLSSVRGGNVIGGGDWGEDRIVPDCIRALTQGKPVLVRNPNSVRPWQFVLDVLAGYLRLAEHQLSGSELYADAWNFGPDESNSLTVANLTEKVIHYWGQGTWQKQDSSKSSSQDLRHEARFLRLDPSKANRILEWCPIYNAEESIRETIHWYRDTQINRNADPYTYSANQLKSYVEMAKERKHPWVIHEKVLR